MLCFLSFQKYVIILNKNTDDTICNTLAKTEIIYPINVGALVAMNFTQDKYPAPRKIEKMKILGALLELPAKQHCQYSPFTS